MACRGEGGWYALVFGSYVLNDGGEGEGELEDYMIWIVEVGRGKAGLW